MGYLRGDYYGGRGDYYQGDPGLFSGLASLFKGAVRVGAGFLTGGPLGALRGAVSHAVAETSGGALTPTGSNPASIAPQTEEEKQLGVVGPSILRQRAAHGVPGTALIGPMPAMHPALMAGMHVRRTHPNKSTYVTRGGGTSRWPVGLQIHPKGTEAVTTRRMNVANPRALRRSLRRVAGFAKLTKRVRRAVSMAASAVGVRHHGKKTIRRK